MSYRNVDARVTQRRPSGSSFGYPLGPMAICIFRLEAVVSRIVQSQALEQQQMAGISVTYLSKIGETGRVPRSAVLAAGSPRGYIRNRLRAQ
jgi:hypothetical protein